MVGHRSTGLPECGPTESSAPEPCFSSILLVLFLNFHSSDYDGIDASSACLFSGQEEECFDVTNLKIFKNVSTPLPVTPESHIYFPYFKQNFILIKMKLVRLLLILP